MVKKKIEKKDIDYEIANNFNDLLAEIKKRSGPALIQALKYPIFRIFENIIYLRKNPPVLNSNFNMLLHFYGLDFDYIKSKDKFYVNENGAVYKENSKDRWIKVKKELPPENKEVLIFKNNGEMVYGKRCGDDFVYVLPAFINDSEVLYDQILNELEDSIPKINGVTHWAPLLPSPNIKKKNEDCNESKH